MAKATRELLKTYFETGMIPTEEQFSDLIDSYYNLEEGGDGPLKIGIPQPDTQPAIKFFKGASELTGVGIGVSENSGRGVLRLSGYQTSVEIGGEEGNFVIKSGSSNVFEIRHNNQGTFINLIGKLRVNGDLLINNIPVSTASQGITMSFDDQRIAIIVNSGVRLEANRPIAFRVANTSNGQEVNFFPINTTESNVYRGVITLYLRDPRLVTVGIMGQFTIDSQTNLIPPHWLPMGNNNYFLLPNF